MKDDDADRTVSARSLWPGFMVTKHQKAIAIGDPVNAGWVTAKTEHTWIGLRTWRRWGKV